jgi:hypothetical protein
MGRNMSDLRESIASLRESVGDLKGAQRTLVWAIGLAGGVGLLARIFHWI